MCLMPLTDGAIMLQEGEKTQGGGSYDIRVFCCFPRIVLIILWQKGPIKFSLTVPEYTQRGTYQCSDKFRTGCLLKTLQTCAQLIKLIVTDKNTAWCNSCMDPFLTINKEHSSQGACELLKLDI